MDFSNIKKVEDLTIMSDTNRRLEEGWVLIGTYTNNYDSQSYPGVNTFHYVVGLPDGIAFTNTRHDTYYEHPDSLEDIKNM